MKLAGQGRVTGQQKASVGGQAETRQTDKKCQDMTKDGNYKLVIYIDAVFCCNR